MTTACLIFTFLMSHSQQFQVATTDTFATGDTSMSIIGASVDVYNLTGINIDMAWELDSLSVPAGWDYTVCDPITCSPPNALGNYWMLESTDGYLLMEMYPHEIWGSGYMRIKVYEVADTVNVQFISLTVDVNTLGISDKEKTINVYPNPAADWLKIDLPGSSRTYKLYNSQGVLVKSGTGNNVNVSSLDEGAYVLRVNADHGAITKKILVSR